MGEDLMLESTGGNLRLTNQRVILDNPANYTVIPLGMVASCTVRTKHSPWLIVLAGLVFLAAAAATNRVPFAVQAVLFGLAAFAFLAYFASRSGTIEVHSSGGGVVAVSTAGMSHEKAKRFADAVCEQIAEHG